MCPKVIVPSLHTISAHERFHRNALVLDSRGNLYNYDQYVKGSNGKSRQHVRTDGECKQKGGNSKKESEGNVGKKICCNRNEECL